MKQPIIDCLSKLLKLKKEEVEKFVEIPPNTEMGDYAFPCFVLSKTLRKPPVEIATEFARELSKLKIKGVERIECNGAYLNFFIDKRELIKGIITKAVDDNFGKGSEKRKILLEHTSINPNASPHVGRARNSIIGDSIARTLRFLGNKVETHYYVNDVSKQVAILAMNFSPKDRFENMLEKYVKASKQIADNPKLEKKVFEMLEKFENNDKKTVEKFHRIVKICIDGQKEIFNKFGIAFDYFDYESMYSGKKSEDVLKKLEKTSKLFKDDEGRIVLNQKGTPVERKMKAPFFVLARSNRTGLYGLRDIAYTLEKMKKGENIIILGEDQKLYFEQISEALKILGSGSPKVVHYSFVLINEDGEKRKMSTRKGELVLLEEFLKEAEQKAEKEIKKRKTKGDALKIAVGAIKYAMLKNDNNKNIVFSWEQSLSFEGDSGPYLQYSYARASSILKNVKKNTKHFDIPAPNEQEIALAKKINEFPEIVQKAGETLNPSIIANYSFQLAQTFNEFYHSCKVVGCEYEMFRAHLVRAFQNTIKKSLYLLGIEVMEEM